jgi:hypothetical protein
VARDQRLDLLAARADHHHGALGAEAVDGGEEMLEHRPPGDRVKHLVEIGLHPRALAGGEDDCGEGARGVDFLAHTGAHRTEILRFP